MKALSNAGRRAGLIYLLLALLAPYRLVYLPAVLFVHGDAAATTRNLVSHETSFRLGMVTDVASGVVLILLTLVLYQWLQAVDRPLAVLMVALGAPVPAAIDFLNVLNDAAALMFAKGGGFLSAFDAPQREALAMTFLRFEHVEVVVAEMFWGLWLFPLAALLWRSRAVPKFLSVWLVINGSAYVVVCVVGLLFPAIEESLSNAIFPALMGELALVLWLLIKGAKPVARAGVAA